MNRVVGLSILLFLSACRQVETANPIGKVNEAVIERYRAALENEDLQAIEGILADDFIGYGPGTKGFTNKSSEIQNWKRHWEVYDNFKFERVACTTYRKKDGLEQGDWVLVWGNFTFMEKKVSSPMTYSYAYHSSYRVEDGKIKTRASNLNVSDLLSQTGYRFAPPANRGVLTQ